LIEACSDALAEYEGIYKGISRRTVQLDIQMMRSEKLGYNAPIEVYDNKYYRYADANYTITNAPISENDLQILSEAVDVLKQFQGYQHFEEMSDVVGRLQDRIAVAHHQGYPIIDFERNDKLVGLEFLSPIYDAISKRQTLHIRYRSFRSKVIKDYYLFPYLLKEYRNRWFVFGMRPDKEDIINFALDRIKGLDISVIPFRNNPNFNPNTYFDDIIGVTKYSALPKAIVKFKVTNENASYILTKPIHHSQRLIDKMADGSMIFEMTVLINLEFYREMLGYGSSLTILEPLFVVEDMKERALAMVRNYG
jgi:predicted DNA-binding transcriptional regulator YafY